MRNDYTDYIAHGHKYFAVVDLGKKNDKGQKQRRYFYSAEEYSKYLKGVTKVADTVKKVKAAASATKWTFDAIRNTNKEVKALKKTGMTESEAREKIKLGNTATVMKRAGLKMNSERIDFGVDATGKRRTVVSGTDSKGNKYYAVEGSRRLVKSTGGGRTHDVQAAVEENYKGGGKNDTAKELIKANKQKTKPRYNEPIGPKQPKYKEPIGPQKPNKPKGIQYNNTIGPKQPNYTRYDENVGPSKPNGWTNVKAETEFDKWALQNGLPRKVKNTSPAQDCKDINPDYNPYDYGTSHNCALCTLAFDLRRRGYDVDAASMEPGYKHIDTTISGMEKWYKDVNYKTPLDHINDDLSDYVKSNKKEYEYKMKSNDADGYTEEESIRKIASEISAKKFNDAILESANGDSESWGFVSIQWRGEKRLTTSGAHAIAYYQSKDTVSYYDCQTGEKVTNVSDIIYDSALLWDGIWPPGSVTSASDAIGFMRTDNKELNVNNEELKLAVKPGDNNDISYIGNDYKRKYTQRYFQ